MALERDVPVWSGTELFVAVGQRVLCPNRLDGRGTGLSARVPGALGSCRLIESDAPRKPSGFSAYCRAGTRADGNHDFALQSSLVRDQLVVQRGGVRFEETLKRK